MAQTRQEIIDETRGTGFTPIAHYTSEPYPTVDGDATTTVDVSIVGADDTGYILRTRDDADGPSDDLGTEVYPTLAAAVTALRSLVLARPDGWRELTGEYAEA